MEFEVPGNVPGSLLLPLSFLDVDTFPPISDRKLIVMCAIGTLRTKVISRAAAKVSSEILCFEVAGSSVDTQPASASEATKTSGLRVPFVMPKRLRASAAKR